MNELLTDKAESVQGTLEVLRVLKDTISDQIDWFTQQHYINDAQASIVRDVVMDIQTMLVVLDDYLKRAKQEQDEIVTMLLDIRQMSQPKGGAA